MPLENNIAGLCFAHAVCPGELTVSRHCRETMAMVQESIKLRLLSQTFRECAERLNLVDLQRAVGEINKRRRRGLRREMD